MNAHMHHSGHADMVTIIRGASLYDWLINRSRSQRLPQPLPPHLHADLGLVAPEAPSDRSGWRPFG